MIPFRAIRGTSCHMITLDVALRPYPLTLKGGNQGTVGEKKEIVFALNREVGNETLRQ